MLERMTEGQRKAYELLRAGVPRSHEDLRACLTDDLSGTVAVPMMISRLRKIVAVKGLYIINEQFDGRFMYRLVRIIPGEE